MCKASGLWKKPRLHAVGDGAKWITEQVGVNGSYLIDFFHLCDNLSEANPKNQTVDSTWYTEQKALLKTGYVEQIIDALKSRGVADNEEESV